MRHANGLRRPTPRRGRSSIRTAIAVLLLGAAATGFTAPAAEAAPPRVWIQLTDPLATDPVRLQVAAVDADGLATAFTGTVALSVGRTRSAVTVRSTDGQEEVEIPTAALDTGSATVTAVLQANGRTVRSSIVGFIDLPPTVVLRGFGCGVISPSQKRIAWQVVSVDGQPYRYPAWTPGSSTFPAYVRTVRPSVITDSLGRPVRSRGVVVVRSGTRVVGRVTLPNATRRLLFSVPWPGKLVPGPYTATVTLTDATGRTATSSQGLVVANRSAGLCSS